MKRVKSGAEEKHLHIGSAASYTGSLVVIPESVQWYAAWMMWNTLYGQ
ncbi:MAG: hypothetical protein IPH18_10990 [Chitinophagaceae bacterium]|nr:hypothetical protein [Chitinophagaceae bacterium]